jgi:hypothetical protein
VYDARIVAGLVGGQPVLLLKNRDVTGPGQGKGACQRDANDPATDDSDSFSHVIASLSPRSFREYRPHGVGAPGGRLWHASPLANIPVPP